MIASENITSVECFTFNEIFGEAIDGNTEHHPPDRTMTTPGSYHDLMSINELARQSQAVCRAPMAIRINIFGDILMIVIALRAASFHSSVEF